MSEQTADPKIVVDEDWKDRVRAEREAARQAEREAARQAERTHPGRDAQPAHPPGPPPDEFTILVSSLATQAMMALGQLPDPSQGHAVVRPELAKHLIDTLAMLERKTQGNLSGDEARMLDDVLHQLRLLFVSVYRAPPAESGEQSAESGEQSAESGELPS